MSRGNATMVALLSVLGAWGAAAAVPCPAAPDAGADQCYFLKFENFKLRILPFRTGAQAPDFNLPEERLLGVTKIKRLHGEVSIRRPIPGTQQSELLVFCHVETVRSLSIGPRKPKSGWIESTFIGRSSDHDCHPAGYVPLRR